MSEHLWRALESLCIASNSITILWLTFRDAKLERSIRNMDWLKSMHYGKNMKDHGTDA